MTDVSRDDLLRRLLVGDTDPDEIVSELRVFGWDSDGERVALSRGDALAMLARFVRGEVHAEFVEGWANAIEGREDIGRRGGCVRRTHLRSGEPCPERSAHPRAGIELGTEAAPRLTGRCRAAPSRSGSPTYPVLDGQARTHLPSLHPLLQPTGRTNLISKSRALRMIKEWTVETMHALVVVVDPENKAAVIPETGLGHCTSTSSSIAVPVKPYVDGPVSLWLGPLDLMERRIVVFEGELDCPSGRLGVELPEDGHVTSIPVGTPVANVAVSVDRIGYEAGRVWVGVAPAPQPVGALLRSAVR